MHFLSKIGHMLKSAAYLAVSMLAAHGVEATMSGQPSDKKQQAAAQAVGKIVENAVNAIPSDHAQLVLFGIEAAVSIFNNLGVFTHADAPAGPVIPNPPTT